MTKAQRTTLRSDLRIDLLQTEEGIPWKQTERDALKKSFLSFGLGRWDAVNHAFLERVFYFCVLG